MLAITRYQLLEHLSELPAIVDGYARRELFVQHVLEWMSRTEGSLQQLRNPLASQFAAERARILAVSDGLRQNGLTTERISKRKAERAITALALNRVEESLRNEVHAIDRKLEDMREKMASFVAAVSVRIPISAPPPEPRQEWLRHSWQRFGELEETRKLYVYLNASLSPSDRLFLLEEIVQDLVGDGPCNTQVADRERPTGDES